MSLANSFDIRDVKTVGVSAYVLSRKNHWQGIRVKTENILLSKNRPSCHNKFWLFSVNSRAFFVPMFLSPVNSFLLRHSPIISTAFFWSLIHFLRVFFVWFFGSPITEYEPYTTWKPRDRLRRGQLMKILTRTTIQCNVFIRADGVRPRFR